MKSAYQSSAEVAGPAGFTNAWSRFWFRPTDPTTLGFMRIMTGMLVVYVHLAYCFDFQTFFGAKGWLDKPAIDRERKELPVYVANWTWESPKMTFSGPPMADRRVAVFDFLKHLPTEKAERDQVLRYLYFALEYGSRGQPIPEKNFLDALRMLKSAGQLTTEQHQKMVTLLGKEPFDARAFDFSLPDFFIAMTIEERLRTWNDSLRLLEFLPSNSENFNHVMDWLQQTNSSERQTITEFLRELPSGAEGQQIIDYIEFWRQDPRTLHHQGRPIFSLWFHISDPTTMWIFHLIFIGIFVLFTIGFWTRVTSVMTWLAALCYIHRIQYVLFGMDTMMNILLFYLMIGPSGAALSVDRLIARYRAGRAIARAGGQSVPWAEAVLAGPQPSAMANFTIRLIQIHFCFIYAASGLAKLKGTMWWNSEAAWYTIANPEFCPVQFPPYERALYLLASFRPLLMVSFAAITYFTLALEISLPFLIWTRMRPFLICLSAFLHSGIAWFMGLTCFGLLMMTLLLSYVPAAVIRERLTWPLGSGEKLTLRYRTRNSRQARLASILRAIDLTGQMTFQEVNDHSEGEPIRLTGPDRRTASGSEVVAEAMSHLVFGRVIAWIPFASILIRCLTNGDGAKADVAKVDNAKTPMLR